MLLVCASLLFLLTTMTYSQEVPKFTFPDDEEEDSTETVQTTPATTPATPPTAVKIYPVDTSKKIGSTNPTKFNFNSPEIQKKNDADLGAWYDRPWQFNIWGGYASYSMKKPAAKFNGQTWFGLGRFLQLASPDSRVYSGMEVGITKSKGTYESSDSNANKVNFKVMEFNAGFTVYWKNLYRNFSYNYWTIGGILGKNSTEDYWSTGEEKYTLWYTKLEWNFNMNETRRAFSRTDIELYYAGALSNTYEKVNKYTGESINADTEDKSNYHGTIVQNIFANYFSGTGVALTFNAGVGYFSRGNEAYWQAIGDMTFYQGWSDFFRVRVTYDSYPALNKEVVTAIVSANVPLSIKGFGKLFFGMP